MVAMDADGGGGGDTVCVCRIQVSTFLSQVWTVGESTQQARVMGDYLMGRLITGKGGTKVGHPSFWMSHASGLQSDCGQTPHPLLSDAQGQPL